MHIDIPVDPQPVELLLGKSVNRSLADIGEFVQYRLSLQNSSETTQISRVAVTDQLPLGFRYQQGSLRINDHQAADPEISSDGRTLQLAIGDLPAGSLADVSYVTEITAGATPGDAVNTARATAAGDLRSNLAKASVLVKETFFRNQAFLAGRVLIGSCEDDDDGKKPGLAGIRIYLEDGSYVLTDAEGRYHFEGIDPGVHVVQLDFDTLPGSYEVLPCEADNQSAGRSFSRFVDLQGGTLWRADFHVNLRPLPQGTASLALVSTVAADLVQLQLPVAVSGEVDLANVRLSLILPAGMSYVPGSTGLGTFLLADPEGGGQILTYRLGDQAAGWNAEVRLQARITSEASGDLPVKAVITCDTPQKKNLRSPMAENLLQAPALSGGSATVVSGDSGPLTVAFAGLRPGEESALAAAEELPADIKMPAFDEGWMAKANPGIAWLWPLPDMVPAIASVKVAIQHLPMQTIALRVNGEEVSPLAFDGTRLAGDGRLAVSFWRGIDILHGDNLFEATVSDQAGSVVETLRQNIHYSYAPVYAELVPEQSNLVADGKTPPVIAVRFMDKDGYPASAGLVGDFNLSVPYLTYVGREQPITGFDVEQRSKFRIDAGGIAHIQLEPTTQAGEVVMNFPFVDRPQELRAWLQPAIATGSWSASPRAPPATRPSTATWSAPTRPGRRHVYTDGQVEFFAKGGIKGEWLLTIAYDSAKPEWTATACCRPSTPTPTIRSTAMAPSRLRRGQRREPLCQARTRPVLCPVRRHADRPDRDRALPVQPQLNGFKSEMQGDRFATRSSPPIPIRPSSRTKFAATARRASIICRAGTGDQFGGVAIQARDRFHSETIVRRYRSPAISITTSTTIPAPSISSGRFPARTGTSTRCSSWCATRPNPQRRPT